MLLPAESFCPENPELLRQREAQAAELLRIACQPATRMQLLRYAAKLCGGDEDTAQEYYQQALLDGHDWIQSRGFAGTREQDYKFYLLAVIKNQHRTELRRLGRMLPFEEREEEADYISEAGPAHLVDQINREIEHHPDRVLLRLSADEYSCREIQQLTGQPWRTVARRVAQLKEDLRATFIQAWESMEESH